jgi:hypothetical protein
MKNTKLISFILVLISAIIGVYFRFCGNPHPTPECSAPTGLVATVPPFSPDSLHVNWNVVASATNYHVQVFKTVGNVLLKDSITDKTSIKFGTIPVGTKLTVNVSTICTKTESAPASVTLMSGDGGAIAIEDDINGIPPVPRSLESCFTRCATLFRATGTFSVNQSGVASPEITWNKCESPTLRYYFIYMVDTTPSSRKFAKIINVGEPLRFTPTCGLTPGHTYNYTIYPLDRLCMDLPAPICY